MCLQVSWWQGGQCLVSGQGLQCREEGGRHSLVIHSVEVSGPNLSSLLLLFAVTYFRSAMVDGTLFRLLTLLERYYQFILGLYLVVYCVCQAASVADITIIQSSSQKKMETSHSR